MAEHTWKVGDWCFYEFKLAVVDEVIDGSVRSVSTGYIVAGSTDFSDSLVPLSKHAKRFSDEVAIWSDRIHKASGGLNFPDIHRKLVELWFDGCETFDDETTHKKAYEAVRAFGQGVLDAVDKYKYVMVDGVRIFGR